MLSIFYFAIPLGIKGGRLSVPWQKSGQACAMGASDLPGVTQLASASPMRLGGGGGSHPQPVRLSGRRLLFQWPGLHHGVKCEAGGRRLALGAAGVSRHGDGHWDPHPPLRAHGTEGPRGAARGTAQGPNLLAPGHACTAPEVSLPCPAQDPTEQREGAAQQCPPGGGSCRAGGGGSAARDPSLPCPAAATSSPRWPLRPCPSPPEHWACGSPCTCTGPRWCRGQLRPVVTRPARPGTGEPGSGHPPPVPARLPPLGTPLCLLICHLQGLPCAHSSTTSTGFPCAHSFATSTGFSCARSSATSRGSPTTSTGFPCDLGNPCTPPSLIFGAITCFTGLLGVFTGAGATKWCRLKTQRADPLVCAVGMLGSAIFICLIFVAAKTSILGAYVSARHPVQGQDRVPGVVKGVPPFTGPRRGRWPFSSPPDPSLPVFSLWVPNHHHGGARSVPGNHHPGSPLVSPVLAVRKWRPSVH
uniref:Uncharacterized protein n=1 Tax=Monodelphis domestica TaxID=13616 RepID=A0A5F8HBC0_MONDO